MSVAWKSVYNVSAAQTVACRQLTVASDSEERLTNSSAYIPLWMYAACDLCACGGNRSSVSYHDKRQINYYYVFWTVNLLHTHEVRRARVRCCEIEFHNFIIFWNICIKYPNKFWIQTRVDDDAVHSSRRWFSHGLHSHIKQSLMRERHLNRILSSLHRGDFELVHSRSIRVQNFQIDLHIAPLRHYSLHIPVQHGNRAFSAHANIKPFPISSDGW